MSTMRSLSRASLELITVPDTPCWGVNLYSSELGRMKQLLLNLTQVVTKTSVTVRGDGVRVSAYPNQKAAVDAAVRRIVKLEASSYVAMTGLIPLERVSLSALTRHDDVGRAFLTLEEQFFTAAAGNELWLVQLPTEFQSAISVATFQDVLADGANMGATLIEVGSEVFGLLAVDAASAVFLPQICPVSYRVGLTSDPEAVALAQLAANLWCGQLSSSPRRALAAALEQVRLLLA